MKKILLVFSFALLVLNLNIAQNVNPKEAEFDKVFESLADNSKPGLAAGLIKDGEVIYLKGYGNANIERDLPITKETIFQLGELSKQFTSLAILLLEDQGTVSLNDDIRNHVPELPAYEYTVTIGHLLNHTSGLHDINRINNLINGSMNITTQVKALNLIVAQKKLAFEPGTDFSFHEAVTESVLMAEIVSRATDQTFAEFVRDHIFEPLGMKNSFIRDNANSIHVNVAQPFQALEGSNSYNKNEVQSSVLGAINAYCSAEDLAKWYMNYDKPNGKIGQLIQKLDTPVKTTDGQIFEYYWGKMAIGREFTHPERGLPIFWNYGLQGAYGANVFRYLDQKIIAFVLGNNNQYNGGLAHDLVDVLVNDLYPLPPTIDFNTKDIRNLSSQELKRFEGNYWFNEGYASQLFVENDTLRSKWLFGKNSQTLVPLSNDSFQQFAKMEDTRLFKFKEEDDSMTIYFTYNESAPDIMKRYQPVKPSEQELKSYEGIYCNANYGSLFNFAIKDSQLTAMNINHSDIQLTPITKDVFTSTSMFFNAITFMRGSSNNIKGFKIVTDGVHNLIFEKVVK